MGYIVAGIIIGGLLGLWARVIYSSHRTQVIDSALSQLSSWLEPNHHLDIRQLCGFKSQTGHLFMVHRLTAGGMVMDFTDSPTYFAPGDPKPQSDTMMTVSGQVSAALVYKTGRLIEFKVNGATLTRPLNGDEIIVSTEILRKARRQVASYRPH